MRSKYYMVRPSVAHTADFRDLQRPVLRYNSIPTSALYIHALVDENERYFGSFVFNRMDGAQWDIVKDGKIIEREKNNPTGLLSRLMSAYRTKAEVDKIWMLVKRGL